MQHHTQISCKLSALLQDRDTFQQCTSSTTGHWQAARQRARDGCARMKWSTATLCHPRLLPALTVKTAGDEEHTFAVARRDALHLGIQTVHCRGPCTIQPKVPAGRQLEASYTTHGMSPRCQFNCSCKSRLRSNLIDGIYARQVWRQCPRSAHPIVACLLLEVLCWVVLT